MKHAGKFRITLHIITRSGQRNSDGIPATGNPATDPEALHRIDAPLQAACFPQRNNRFPEFSSAEYPQFPWSKPGLKTAGNPMQRFNMGRLRVRRQKFRPIRFRPEAKHSAGEFRTKYHHGLPSVSSAAGQKTKTSLRVQRLQHSISRQPFVGTCGWIIRIKNNPVLRLRLFISGKTPEQPAIIKSAQKRIPRVIRFLSGIPSRRKRGVPHTDRGFQRTGIIFSRPLPMSGKRRKQTPQRIPRRKVRST